MDRLRQKHARYLNESMATEGGNRKQSLLTSPLKLRSSIPPLDFMSV